MTVQNPKHKASTAGITAQNIFSFFHPVKSLCTAYRGFLFNNSSTKQ